jgi:glycosyltransferase involved in cell wall biosynthesis
LLVSQLAHSIETPREAPTTKLRRIAIVPALNEERSVGRVLDELHAFDPELHVVVVDDGSIDTTAEVAVAHGAEVLRLPFNLGIGGAVQTGYRYALERGFGVVVQVDGDGQHDPAELPKIIDPLLRGEADIVIGSRYAGDRTYRAPLSRRLGQWIFARLVSIFVGQTISDTSSSFRALNRRALRLFAQDYPHGYLETVESTVMAARHGLQIKEVPVLMRERVEGRSRLTTGLSIFYAAKVIVAVFIGLFRRTTLDLREDL